MKTIELFAGIGGFRIAADQLGLETVWANDICESAGRVYADRFEEAVFHLGDINALRSSVPRHDLLTGGFPCQPFSSAGKKKGIKDSRGTLFNNIVEILRDRSPRCFVLENVKRLPTMDRGVHFATILSALSELNYRIEWRLVNALNLGLPQNRQRVLIVGHRERPNRSHPFLRDNCLTFAMAKLDDFQAKRVTRHGLCEIDEWTAIADHGAKFPNWGIAWKGAFYGANLDGFSGRLPPVKLRDVLQT